MQKVDHVLFLTVLSQLPMHPHYSYKSGPILHFNTIPTQSLDTPDVVNW